MQLCRKCHVMLSSQLEPTWTLTFVAACEGYSQSGGLELQPVWQEWQLIKLLCHDGLRCLSMDGLRCLQPIWVQCLGFTHHLLATYCAHLVLISNFLFPQCAFQLPASIWFHMSASPRWPLHNFLPLCCFMCLSATSCMHLVTISRLPLSLNNF